MTEFAEAELVARPWREMFASPAPARNRLGIDFLRASQPVAAL